MPTAEQLAAAREAAEDRVSISKDVYGDDLLDTDGGFDGATRDFESAAVAMSLRNAGPALEHFLREARVRGAVDEARALEGPGGVRYFAAAAPGGGAEGLATIRGDDRFVTLRLAGKEGESIVAASWLPEDAEADARADAETDARIPDIDLAAEEDLVACAALYEGRARPGDERGLGGLLDRLAAGDSVPWEARIGSVSLRAFGSGKRQRLGAHGNLVYASWTRYAAAVRDLFLSGPPGPGGEVVTGTGGYDAEDTLEADGGFWGETTELRASAVRESIQSWRLKELAAVFVRTAEDVLAAGYAWPAKLLEYADHDRFTFAAASPDGSRIGRWHRNADLFSDVQATMAVVVRDASGKPERIELHAAYQPPGRFLEDGFGNGREAAAALAGDALFHAAPEADPPRLTRWELARRIAEGEPLPPPAGGIDLLTGELLPGTVEDALQVVENALGGLRQDHHAMKAIAAGETDDMVVEDEAFDQAGEPGATPRGEPAATLRF